MKFDLTAWIVMDEKWTCLEASEIDVGSLDDLEQIMTAAAKRFGTSGPRFNPIEGTFIVDAFGVHEEWRARIQANKKTGAYVRSSV